MSDNSFSIDENLYGSDTPPKQPPRILFILGLLSVFLGTMLGIYGVLEINEATASKQFLLGSTGYFLTIVIPILLLQLIRMKHKSALKVNEETPYNIGAGEELTFRGAIVVGIGLVSAALAITVFFWPIAQEFGK